MANYHKRQNMHLLIAPVINIIFSCIYIYIFFKKKNIVGRRLKIDEYNKDPVKFSLITILYIRRPISKRKMEKINLADIQKFRIFLSHFLYLDLPSSLTNSYVHRTYPTFFSHWILVRWLSECIPFHSKHLT